MTRTANGEACGCYNEPASLCRMLLCICCQGATDMLLACRIEHHSPQTCRHCVTLREWFDYRGHVCMVFERLGLSLYDFLRKNSYRPFHADIIRAFGRQLLEAVAYLHDLGLIHTDLKPENILLQSPQYDKKTPPASSRQAPPLPGFCFINLKTDAVIPWASVWVIHSAQYVCANDGQGCQGDTSRKFRSYSFLGSSPLLDLGAQQGSKCMQQSVCSPPRAPEARPTCDTS